MACTASMRAAAGGQTCRNVLGIQSCTGTWSRLQYRSARATASLASLSKDSSPSPTPASDEALASSIRQLMRTSAQPVAVITTILPDERSAHGATLSSFSTISLDPPLVAFSIRTPSRLAEALSHHGSTSDCGAHFTINVLSEEQEDVANSFARPGLEPCSLIDLQARSTNAHTTTDHPLIYAGTLLSKHAKSRDGCPIPVLTESLGALSCSLVHRLNLRDAFSSSSNQAANGSSDLFIARIHAVEDLGDLARTKKPLIYRNRGFTTVI